MKPSKTKEICQVCGDNYSSENLELGICCGRNMIVVDNENYEKELENHERCIEKAKKKGRKDRVVR